MAGVIDADYIGEIRVILRNHSPKTFCIKPGDKIAQIIFESIKNEEPMQEVQKLPRTQRGEQGFGSTDKPKKKVVAPPTKEESVEEIKKEEPLKLSKEERFYKRILDRYAPSGRCPHGVGMYCSEMLNDCWSCRAEIQKRQIWARQKAEEANQIQEDPPKVEELSISKQEMKE